MPYQSLRFRPPPTTDTQPVKTPMRTTAPLAVPEPVVATPEVPTKPLRSPAERKPVPRRKSPVSSFPTGEPVVSINNWQVDPQRVAYDLGLLRK